MCLWDGKLLTVTLINVFVMAVSLHLTLLTISVTIVSLRYLLRHLVYLCIASLHFILGSSIMTVSLHLTLVSYDI